MYEPVIKTSTFTPDFAFGLILVATATILVSSSIVGQASASAPSSSVRDTAPGSDEISKNVKGIKEKDHLKENVNSIIDKVKERSKKLHDSAIAAIQNTR